MISTTLYHATTPRKLARCRQTGAILPPVRGFNTEAAAREWARLHHRDIIICFLAERAWKLPDHHNQHGQAYWNEGPISVRQCTVLGGDMIAEFVREQSRNRARPLVRALRLRARLAQRRAKRAEQLGCVPTCARLLRLADQSQAAADRVAAKYLEKS